MKSLHCFELRERICNLGGQGTTCKPSTQAGPMRKLLDLGTNKICQTHSLKIKAFFEKKIDY